MSARARTIYAETDAGKLGATIQTTADGSQRVLVYSTLDGMNPAYAQTYGWYNIDRFEGGKLTAASLRKLFTRQEARP